MAMGDTLKYLKSGVGVCDTWQVMFGIWAIVELYPKGTEENGDGDLTAWAVVIGLCMFCSAVLVLLKCLDMTFSKPVLTIFYLVGFCASVLASVCIFFAGTAEPNSKYYNNLAAALCHSICMGIFYLYASVLTNSPDSSKEIAVLQVDGPQSATNTAARPQPSTTRTTANNGYYEHL